MAAINNNPNARFDHGPNAAGCGRVSNQSVLQGAGTTGLNADSTEGAAELRAGFSAAGVPRNNTGPHVAGAPRSYNGT